LVGILKDMHRLMLSSIPEGKRMEIVLGIAAFALGVALVIGSAEKLVEGLVGVSLAFRLSTFLLAVLLVGFDAENLGLGIDAAARSLPGIALGTIIGASMVATAFAIGLTAIIRPVEFSLSRKGVLFIAPVAVLAAWLLSLDGVLSRTDGVVLLAVFVGLVAYLIWESKRGLVIRGEAHEAMEEVQREHHGKIFYGGLVIATLVGLVIGAELAVWGTRRILDISGISGTLFGMTVVAFAVSVEELARTLIPALKGHSEIAVGNVIGSAAYFFTFNAGLIALVAPLLVESQVRWNYYPFALAAAVVVGILGLKGRIGRAGGALLLGLYLAFVALVAVQGLPVTPSGG
jgi:cation:H+ antiporter